MSAGFIIGVVNILHNMHAVKCAWAGQAFAVAGCNDSGGRKTRIRRSKEERKSMVETFIKT